MLKCGQLRLRYWVKQEWHKESWIVMAKKYKCKTSCKKQHFINVEKIWVALKIWKQEILSICVS